MEELSPWQKLRQLARESAAGVHRAATIVLDRISTD